MQIEELQDALVRCVEDRQAFAQELEYQKQENDELRVCLLCSTTCMAGPKQISDGAESRGG